MMLRVVEGIQPLRRADGSPAFLDCGNTKAAA